MQEKPAYCARRAIGSYPAHLIPAILQNRASGWEGVMRCIFASRRRHCNTASNRVQRQPTLLAPDRAQGILSRLPAVYEVNVPSHLE